MNFFSPIFETVSVFFASDPAVLTVQILMSACAFFVVFLVLFTTRDILLRTNSFLLQACSILLVAVLPIVGFFIYVLIRPSRTLAERAMHRDIIVLLSKLNPTKKPDQPKHEKHVHKK